MNIFLQYTLLIYFLPLIAFGIQIFIGKRLPRQGDWLSIGAVLATLVLSIALFAGMLLDYNPDFKQNFSFTWLETTNFKISMGFLVDNVTIICRSLSPQDRYISFPGHLCYSKLQRDYLQQVA